MSATISNHISDLVDYAILNGLADPLDRVFFCNRLLPKLGISAFEPDREPNGNRPVAELLAVLCRDAAEQNLLSADSVTEQDLFDTELMGILTPPPSAIIGKFNELYRQSPEKATDYYYDFAKKTNYIRTDRIQKDLKWTYEGKYGTLDITVNLSKPEKDPKAIAAAKTQKRSGYPKCAICRENEGYSGSMTQAARQSHRLIPMTVAGKQWYLQYSPYVYYNEHCIALSAEHTPMKIDRDSFVKQLDFVTLFPHYFLGSNADLPIVGGSILTHDHMQGGHYTFAMERAKIEKPLQFKGYEDISAGIVKWPLSVIRLRSADRERLTDLADKILGAWRAYTDADAGIYAQTNGEPHNTITPIARRRGADFELDLVLRNNITTEEHPLGVYHPHADKHNIKKENIGLIEVMGLAVLPARLKKEMNQLAECLVNGQKPADFPEIAKHQAWVDSFIGNYRISKDNVNEILQKEIGKTFEAVLEDAGVFPCTEKGRADFGKFIDSVNA